VLAETLLPFVPARTGASSSAATCRASGVRAASTPWSQKRNYSRELMLGVELRSCTAQDRTYSLASSELGMVRSQPEKQGISDFAFDFEVLRGLREL